MNLRISDLWRLDGAIDRWPYFTLGASLGALKMGLDFVVATWLFNRNWSPFEYAVPGPWLFAISPQDQFFFRVMLVVALPFIWCGIGLTLRRLRSAGLPLFAVTLFFVPLPINLILFLILSILPARPARGGIYDEIDEDWRSSGDVKTRGMLGKALPERRWGAALAAIVLPLPFALVLTAFSTRFLQYYGWGMFVGIPFVLPMISVILYGYRRPRPLSDCLWLAMLWLGVAYTALIFVALEGIICVAMLLPLAVPIALLGSAVGYLIQARRLTASETGRLLLMLIAVLPTLIGAEAVSRPDASLFAVHTSVEVDARPDQVWPSVIRFDPLPVPDDWTFHTGLSYPVRAEIDGWGVGAIRRCVFSTGAFIEPIEVWDEPRLLRFAVTSNPRPMREWNPFAEIHPPHLDGFLIAHRGEFRLTEIAGGRTRLEGTTWYQHHLWPAAYWRLWSDAVIHRIHRRVLEHIKRSVERD